MYNEFLEEASNKIHDTQAKHEKLAEKLLPLKNSDILGQKLIQVTKKLIPKGIIAGVDSGFVSKKLSFIDLVLIRTVGVIFYYKEGKLDKAEYYPSAFLFPKPFMLKNGLEKDEEQQSISLHRLKQEVQTSIDIIEKYNPKYIFVDGSIVPQYQDKPRKESEINSEYNSIVMLFEKFYETAEKNNCKIIACVEDSRGTRFKQIIEEKLLKNESLPNFFDSAILDSLLVEGERTLSFTYTKEFSSHAILKDIEKKWAEAIKVFYIKPTKFDKPLRVEFISSKESEKDEEEIASLVFALSSFHREYSYPSVLIEADLRAGLNEQDISVVYDRLIDKLGPKVRMRRNSRPFK
jgi:hypothetical protein